MQVHLTGWRSSDGREWVALRSGYNSAFVTELKGKIDSHDRMWHEQLRIWLVRPSKAMALDQVVRWAWGGAHAYCTECSFSHACKEWDLVRNQTGHPHPVTGTDHGWKDDNPAGVNAHFKEDEKRRAAEGQKKHQVPFDSADFDAADFQRIIDEFIRGRGAFGGFTFRGFRGTGGGTQPPRPPPPPVLGPYARAAALLGVKIDATPEEVKKAARPLIFQHHPDRGGDRKKMEEVIAARDLLLPKKEREPR